METGIEVYTPEWFKERQGTFTGSEVWKLMTNSRTKGEQFSKTAETYILEKVWEKLSGQTKQGMDNFATEWGNENEPVAKAFYQKLTGNIIQESKVVYSPNIANFTGSPDGLVGATGLIEIKCPFNGSNHLKHCCITDAGYMRKEHPEYYWQCMSYMLMTERDWCDFVSFDPRIDSHLGLFVYRLEADQEAFDELTERIEQARELFNQYFKLFTSLK